MVEQIILHIGLHRTGTSSFQAVMKEHADDFLKAGIDPYVTAQGRTHARELAFVCLRPDVFDVPHDDGLDASVRSHIDQFIATSQSRCVLFSSEHLSLMRLPTEILHLKSYFPRKDVKFRILVVLREKEEWFASYKDQVLKEGHLGPKTDQSSKNIDGESWVKDHQSMLELFRQHFEDVIVLEYDKIHMTSIMLRTLGIDPSFNTQAYRRNKRSLRDRIGPIPYKVIRSILGTESHGPIKAFRQAREKYLRYRK